MDTILVRYSGSEEPISIRDFIYPEKPLNLTETERKIQESTRLVYELNGKEPPLYKNFNNRDPKKPLTINCHSRIRSGLEAYYDNSENEINFVNSKGNLVVSLAHELKHAEQSSDAELQQISNGEDNKAKGNVLLIDEAEAVWTGSKVGIETGQDESKDGYYDKLYRQLLHEYTDKKESPNFSKIKEKMMTTFIEDVSKLTILGYYFNQVEVYFPENFSDVGLESLPTHYGVSKDFLKIIKDIPLHPSVEHRIEIMKKIPDEMTKLKGSGVEGEKQFIKKLINWVPDMKTPKNLQALFDAMKDENGNLPFAREIFEGQDKDNFLLERLAGEYSSMVQFRFDYGRLLQAHDVTLMSSLANMVNREYCFGAIPVLMSLKDKDGKPIISQENIDHFPERNDLSKAVKAYKRTSIQKGLEKQAKAGAKKLGRNPEGYVKKGKTTCVTQKMMAKRQAGE